MVARERKCISQTQLSEFVTQKTISRENGIDVPTIETLDKLAYALGMKIIVVEDE